MKSRQTTPDFSHILKNSPSRWILRRDLTVKTGGLLNGRTAANLDSQGIGIKGRILIGKKKIAYPAEEVVRFLEEQSQLIPDKASKG